MVLKYFDHPVNRQTIIKMHESIYLINDTYVSEQIISFPGKNHKFTDILQPNLPEHVYRMRDLLRTTALIFVNP